MTTPGVASVVSHSYLDVSKLHSSFSSFVSIHDSQQCKQKAECKSYKILSTLGL